MWVARMKRSRLPKSAFRSKLKGRLRRMELTGYAPMRVFVVNAELVRHKFGVPDFSSGHGLYYKFIPKNEIWIDDDYAPDRRKFVVLHEVTEHKLMSEGMNYDFAHKEAEIVEDFARQHPADVDSMIRIEMQ
jgi:hypothetical protein